MFRYIIYMSNFPDLDLSVHDAMDLGGNEYGVCLEEELFWEEKMSHQWRVLFFSFILGSIFRMGFPKKRKSIRFSCTRFCPSILKCFSMSIMMWLWIFLSRWKMMKRITTFIFFATRYFALGKVLVIYFVFSSYGSRRLQEVLSRELPPVPFDEILSNVDEDEEPYDSRNYIYVYPKYIHGG